jgi:hypothetical protein
VDRDRTGYRTERRTVPISRDGTSADIRCTVRRMGVGGRNRCGLPYGRTERGGSCCSPNDTDPPVTPPKATPP